MTVRTGRFGPYIQLGEQGEDKSVKPKRSSIPRGWDVATLDFERALALLKLPREVGIHPESGKPITAGIGRYGPFVLHDGTYANLDSVEEVFSVGINRAVTLIAEKVAGGGRRGRGAAAKPLKELGDHPDGGGKVTVHEGRYGPYVKHGKINATIPKGTDPNEITMEAAVALIAERSGKPARTKKKAAAGKTAKTAKAGKTAKAKKITKAAEESADETATPKKKTRAKAKRAATASAPEDA